MSSIDRLLSKYRDRLDRAVQRRAEGPGNNVVLTTCALDAEINTLKDVVADLRNAGGGPMARQGRSAGTFTLRLEVETVDDVLSVRQEVPVRYASDALPFALEDVKRQVLKALIDKGYVKEEPEPDRLAAVKEVYLAMKNLADHSAFISADLPEITEALGKALGIEG